MKRAEDISLVKRAYNERPGSGEPTKVKVSHQKLLKKDVFNALKRNRKNHKNYNLLKDLKSTKFFRKHISTG